MGDERIFLKNRQGTISEWQDEWTFRKIGVLFAYGSQRDQSTFNSVNKNDSGNWKVEDHNDYGY